jgi:hypothetical protein
MQLATQEFQAVIDNHPRTPWAKRAAWEMSVGFGMQFYDGYRDPRYDTVVKNIKFPTP